jgi:hypothetical protein
MVMVSKHHNIATTMSIIDSRINFLTKKRYRKLCLALDYAEAHGELLLCTPCLSRDWTKEQTFGTGEFGGIYNDSGKVRKKETEKVFSKTVHCEQCGVCGCNEH